jgi:hypothetical protein
MSWRTVLWALTLYPVCLLWIMALLFWWCPFGEWLSESLSRFMDWAV